MYKELLNKIIEFNQIVIFKHLSPDGDCMYSNLALYYFLKANFKGKKVKLCGLEDFDLITKRDKVSDRFIAESLCVVLDTSTVKRIDDQRALNGKYVIKIDHHPHGEEYADLSYVDTKASATCELLAEILFAKEFKRYIISKKVCEYLYSGIVTDTLNFRTTNVTARTLSIASKLAEIGALKISEIVEFNLDKSLEEFNRRTKFRNKLVINEGFGYVKLDKKALRDIGADYKECKNYIEEIACIKDLNVWCVATINDDNLYEVSLRSKRAYIVNNVAMDFGGGGHLNAAGIKGLDDKRLNELFISLIEISKADPKKAIKAHKI